MTSSYPITDARQGARWMIERAKAAAAAGLDSLFVGDHHASLTPYYQNTPMLARILAEWWDAPAGALYLLPFRHPVLLAEEIATLAAIAPNRFIMQAGLGYGEREFAAFGINPKQRPSRFEEALVIMRRLWAGETVSHQGRWQLQEARISPTPPEKIEVWIAAQAEPAIERAARLGEGWIAAPSLVPEQARQDLDRYLAYCRQHGREPGICAIRRDIYVGETPAEAATTGGQVVATGYRGFSSEATIVGDVEAVAQAFTSLAQLGFTDVLIRNLVPDQSKALASLARLAQVKELMG
jgi:alkanesulfonate monooxygenase SsuD/methylene tetrahydromethanopterin reductase-like flavin-dependent oxidoreductase (luciferase family)